MDIAGSCSPKKAVAQICFCHFAKLFSYAGMLLAFFSQLSRDLTPFLVSTTKVWGGRLVAAAIILFVGYWAARFLLKTAGHTMVRAHIDVTLSRFLCRVLHGFLLVVVVLAVLGVFGVQTTSLVALLGAVGLAIGLALQGSLSNFAAGIMLVVFRPFKVEDAIEVGTVVGTVEEIGLFTATVRTSDNRLIIVPNSTFIAQPVINSTAKTTRRIDFTLGIGYGDNINIAREIILRVLSEDRRVFTSPVPLVAVTNLGDNAVEIAVRPWVRTEDYWAARYDLLDKLKTAVEEGGCTIPYPQRAVHVYHADEK
jgi:small conductance mechanosensitive channel